MSSIFYFPLPAYFCRIYAPSLSMRSAVCAKTSGMQNTTDSAPAFHPQTARAICGSRLCTEKMQTFLTGCTDRSGSLHKCFCFFRSFHLYKSIVHGSQFPRIHAIKSHGYTLPSPSTTNNNYSSRSFHIPLPDILPPSVPDWKTYGYPSPPLRQIRIPQIKQLTQKFSILLRFHRINAALLRPILPFNLIHARNKLHKRIMVAFPEFIKKRSLFCRVIGNDRHYIIVHMVLLQQLHGMHDPRKCILSSGILAIPVMHFLWTIQRQPYQKTMLSQKTRPFLIYQQTIGLYRVFDLQFLLLYFCCSSTAF